MRSMWDDTDTKFDYDKQIEDTRKKIEESRKDANGYFSNPCNMVKEFKFLIGELHAKRKTYHSRPPSGYCFGLFIPHKTRIDSRVEKLSNEKESYHQPDCDQYKEAQAEEKIRQKYADDRTAREKIEISKINADADVKKHESNNQALVQKHEIDAAKEAQTEVIQKGLQMGYKPKR